MPDPLTEAAPDPLTEAVPDAPASDDLAEAVPDPPASDDLAEAFDGLLDALASRARWLRDHPFCEDATDRPGAYMLMVHMLIGHLEEDLLFDADFPTFRVVDPRVRGGGDNPDQRYLMARINGGDTYRIWGRIGCERRVELQIYAGNPYVAGGGGRSAGFLAHEDLKVAADGSFEVIASPEPPRQPQPPSTPASGPPATAGAAAVNWIENPPDGTRILVRQVYGDWPAEGMGEIHIDRAGHEGDLKPLLDADELAARLRRATEGFDSHVGLWPEMVRSFYVERRPPNEMSEPVDPGALGGVSGRFMAFGTWDLAEDEALVVTAWPASGNYQGIQLADLWWSSLEYANRQTSLTGDQAVLGDDGSYTFVVCATDPGVANWLDTMGMRRGVVMLRFDGTHEAEFDPAKRPVARVVPLDGLDRELGDGVARISAAQRRAAIAARRAHVQARFGT